MDTVGRAIDEGPAASRIVPFEHVPEADIPVFWSVYDTAFAPVNEASPCRQSLYEDEFVEAMRSARYDKIGLFEGGRLQSMVVFSRHLEDFAWLSVPFYRARFPEEFASGRLFYFVGLLTRPEVQESGKTVDLLREAIRTVGPDGIALMDVCDGNQWLPEMIEDLGQEQVLTERTLLGQQHYWAIAAKGARVPSVIDLRERAPGPDGTPPGAGAGVDDAAVEQAER